MNHQEWKDLLARHQDNEIYEYVNALLNGLRDEDPESLAIHLQAQLQSLPFCGDNPPGPILKTIIGIRTLIEEKGGDADALLAELDNNK